MVELDELLGNGRGRKGHSVSAEKRRALTIADLVAPDAPIQELSPIKALRHQHHQLARLIAGGKRLEDVCLISGYSIAYVSNLKNDPAFKGLISHYEQQVDAIFIDVQERLRALGIHTVEELQARLAEEPNSFANRELMELAELCFDRSGHGKSHTINNNVAILSIDDLERVKRAIDGKGRVRDISDHQRIEMGRIDYEGRAGAEIHSDSEERNPLPKESGTETQE